jgi:hypothetical protein
MKIMTFDPGGTTGIIICAIGTRMDYVKGLCEKDLLSIYDLIIHERPDIIVYETFKLYPGKSKAQAWSTFVPCEVIGVIKLAATHTNANIYCQGASIKAYSKLDGCPKGNRHVKDAYLHLWYFLNTAHFKNTYLLPLG